MEKQYSNKILISKLIILNILTFGIYTIYWVYKNWKYIKEYGKKDIQPGWRTVGLIVPIYNIWLIYDQFKSIINLANKKKIETNWSAGGLTALFVILSIITIKITLRLPDDYIFVFLYPLLTFIAILPLIPIQNYLNNYWSKVQKHNLESKFATTEIILMVLGIILWAFILIGVGMELSDVNDNKNNLRQEMEQENYYQQQTEEESLKELNYFIVSNIIDGDTIKLLRGEGVRLIGINAPGVGEKCYEEAKEFLEDFILGKEVSLERDVEDRDQYGRLLRYVFIDGYNVNYEMIYLGFAHKYEYGSNTKYSSWFEEAENKSKENEGCLWTKPEEDYANCFVITNFHFNAAGEDNYNLNDEYVTLKNKCNYQIDMTNWMVKDETSIYDHKYYFPYFILQSGLSVTLYTGTGINTNSKLYWKRQEGNYAEIWNNNGDTLFLRDNQGNFVLSKSYGGF